METFSVKRKADRALMAKKLTDIGRVYGAIPEVSEEGSCSATRRYTHVKIKHPSGLCAMVALDGASANHSFHGETFVLSWYLRSPSAYHLSDLFAIAISGTVNPYHRLKATAIAYGFSMLCTKLNAGLQAITDGTAFEAS